MFAWTKFSLTILSQKWELPTRESGIPWSGPENDFNALQTPQLPQLPQGATEILAANSPCAGHAVDVTAVQSGEWQYSALVWDKTYCKSAFAGYALHRRCLPKPGSQPVFRRAFRIAPHCAYCQASFRVGSSVISLPHSPRSCRSRLDKRDSRQIPTGC
jgi:hypothetical protein